MLCGCGKKLKAPAAAAGRKAKCPKCGNVLTVKAPEPEPGEDDFDALYDLAGQESTAAKRAPSAAASCGNCYPSMAPGAVLCTSCGYDTRTGKTLGTVADVAPAPAKAPKPAAAGGTRYVPPLQTKVDADKPAPSGSLLRGTIVSAVCAFIGALVWYAVAKGTHREIGWIAWGVGFAAGAGMMGGYNGHSVHSGSIAAAMSVAGIMAGKFMVFSAIAVPLISKEVAPLIDKIPDEQKVQVTLVQEQLKQKGVDPVNASESELEAARTAAAGVLARMDAKARRQRAAGGKAAMMKYATEEVIEGHRMELFRRVMFAAMDLLFIVLAVASAFKVATFGGEVES